MRSAIASFVFGAALLGGCAPKPEVGTLTPDGSIRIVGYNDMDEMLGSLTQGFSRRHPQFRFHLDLISTRAAPDALIAGRSALAPMGAEMEDSDEDRYRQRFGSEPLAIRVAHASLDPAALSSPTGIFVHKDNPLRSLSLAQISWAFGMKGEDVHMTWGQLGAKGAWRDAPVRLIGLAPDTALGRRTAQILGLDQGFARSIQGFRQSREIAALAAKDRFALSFANLNHARPELRALDLEVKGSVYRADRETVGEGYYPLDRHLLIYAPHRADGSITPFAKAFLRYALSDEGQRLVSEGTRGYIPLSRAERLAELKKLN